MEERSSPRGCQGTRLFHNKEAKPRVARLGEEEVPSAPLQRDKKSKTGVRHDGGSVYERRDTSIVHSSGPESIPGPQAWSHMAASELVGAAGGKVSWNISRQPTRSIVCGQPDGDAAERVEGGGPDSLEHPRRQASGDDEGVRNIRGHIESSQGGRPYVRPRYPASTVCQVEEAPERRRVRNVLRRKSYPIKRLTTMSYYTILAHR